MFDAILELIIEILGEILLQVLAEIFSAAVLKVVVQPFRAGRPTNPYVAALGILVAGAGVGWVSVLVFPHPLTHPSRFPGLSLLLAPLTTGFLMQTYGSWQRRKGGSPSCLATFWGGAGFAFALAFVRWLMISHVAL